MKKVIVMVMMAMATFAIPQTANAQFLKNLGKAAEKVGKDMLKAMTDSTEQTSAKAESGKKISSIDELKEKKADDKNMEVKKTTAVQTTEKNNGTQKQETKDPFADCKIVTGYPDFKINIKRCEAADKTVLIELTLLNNTDTDVEEFSFYGGCSGTKLYDDQGNIYEDRSVLVKMANKEYGCYSDYIKLVAGLPTKMSIMVYNVPLSVKSFALLDLNIFVRPWNINKGTVKLRNIPITRE